MSSLINVLNLVRETATIEWLTPQQREGYEMLRTRASSQSPAILTGPPGSGKTLIGWLLSRELGLGHTTSPSDIPLASTGRKVIVIDNSDLFGRGGRALFGLAELEGWTSALMLGRFLVDEGIPIARLSTPTQTDIARCIGNLPIPLTHASGGGANFWQALLTALRGVELESGHDVGSD